MRIGKVPLLVALPPLAFLVLAGLFTMGLLRENPDELPSVFVGSPAPDIEGEGVGDIPVFDRAALDAPGVKIVNFWASWCGPCRAEHPALMDLAEDYPVYGVNRDVTEANALGFVDELGNPYDAAVFDPGGRESFDWGVYGLPETFVIDGDGNVVLRFPGPIHGVMDTVIADALAEAAGEEPGGS